MQRPPPRRRAGGRRNARVDRRAALPLALGVARLELDDDVVGRGRSSIVEGDLGVGGVAPARACQESGPERGADAVDEVSQGARRPPRPPASPPHASVRALPQPARPADSSPASRGTGAAAVAGAGAGDAWRGSAVAFAGLGTARRRRISSPRAWAMRCARRRELPETLGRGRGDRLGGLFRVKLPDVVEMRDCIGNRRARGSRARQGALREQVDALAPEVGAAL